MDASMYIFIISVSFLHYVIAFFMKITSLIPQIRFLSEYISENLSPSETHFDFVTSKIGEFFQ